MSVTAAQPTFPFSAVVLVADPLDEVVANAETHLRRDLEKTPDYVLADITRSIEDLGLAVHHYRTPVELAATASHHKDDVVLSIYGGQLSRNRMALVPAICESFGLRFIGPDVYGRILCQDKELSKRLAGQAGLTTPAHLILREDADLQMLRSFATPFVIKPLWEGSSIGIGPESLIHSDADGVHVAEQLLRKFDAPLLAESFVPGIEVNFSLIETGDQIEYRLTEAFIPEEPAYFETHLFDAEQKFEKYSRVENRALDLTALTGADLAALLRLPSIVGGIGYGRIDGKIHDGRFHFLEITPDAWLAATGSFAAGFLESGWSYSRVISAVLLSRRG
jgi:D-alanine-D-alanine ligase